jgi:hypothetical protein
MADHTTPTQVAEVIAQLQAEARQKGIDELGHAIIDVLFAMGVRAPSDPTDEHLVPQAQKVKKRVQKTLLRPRLGTDMATVLNIIAHNPGVRGHQIVDLSIAVTGEAINERTMRTALARLKKRTWIEQAANGGWQLTREAKDKAGQDL